jgi:DNA polymerase-3 subunit alpha
LAYLLGITNQNCDFDKPFKLRKDYKLTRYSPPDIDADFMNNQPIYDYVIRKYGQDRVANVGTWNTWQLKQAIQDAVKFNYSIIKETDELGNAVSIDQVAKTISKGIDLRRLKAADEEDEENQLDLLDLLLQQEHVKTYYEKYPKVFEDAKLMLGIIRFVGKHAAGIVISDVPIEEIVPLHRGTNDQKLTQFDKEDLEDLGLLKMDILALKNLETIYKCIDLIKARHNITIDIRKVKPVEGKVFKMLADGFTQGVFQFEGHGMTSLLKRMHPTGFNDLVAGVAIYRPGPLQNKYDEMYIERKKNPLTVQYPHEVLKDVLKDTYGVFLFQEQIMAATRLLAGFNDTEADEFRKIIGKKQIDKLPEMRTKFVSMNFLTSLKLSGIMRSTNACLETQKY